MSLKVGTASPSLAIALRCLRPSTAGVGAAGAAGAWAGAATPGARARSTSALTIRPPGPDPESPCKSSPRSRAIRLAIGEALTRPSPPTAAGEGDAAGAGVDGAGEAGADGVAAGAGPGAVTGDVAPSEPLAPCASGDDACPRAAAPVPPREPSTTSEASPTRAIGSPTGSVSPSWAKISATVPAVSAS